MSSETGRLAEFERELWNGVVEVDDRLYENFAHLLAAFPPAPTAPAMDLSRTPFREWRPTLRNPDDLHAAYSGRMDELTTASRAAASDDLSALDPPAGLNGSQLAAWIGAQLRQHPELAAINALLNRPRRFGELRSLLVSRGATDGARSWQTWMRWLLHFLPNDYSMWVANYSEIFARRTTPVLPAQDAL